MAQHRLRRRLEDVLGLKTALLLAARVFLERQQLDDFRHARDRRDKPSVDHDDVFHVARLEPLYQILRNRFCVFVLRTLADADITPRNREAAKAEVIPRFASDRHQLDVVLILDAVDFELRVHRLEYVARIRAGESFIRRNHEEQSLAALVHFEHRMREALGMRRDILHHRASFFGVRFIGNRRLFRATEFRGRNHIHRVGDLLRALDALYSTANVL